MVGPYLSNVYSINGMLLISRKRLNFCSLIQVFLCVFSAGPSSVMLFQGLKDLIRVKWGIGCPGNLSEWEKLDRCMVREENWPAPVLKTSCITHSVNQLSPFLTVLAGSVIEAGSSCLNIIFSSWQLFFLLVDENISLKKMLLKIRCVVFLSSVMCVVYFIWTVVTSFTWTKRIIIVV